MIKYKTETIDPTFFRRVRFVKQTLSTFPTLSSAQFPEELNSS